MKMNNEKGSLVFFDTEFTGLHQNTSLISIGLIDSNGRTFYAELTDYDDTNISDWILENVINKLYHPKTVDQGKKWSITGTSDEVRNLLYKWLTPIVSSHGIVQFVADVGHYDFVLLIDLLLEDGQTALDLPNYISPTYVDINQIIADDDDNEEAAGAFNRAFNRSREEIAGVGNTITTKHNALYDALICREIFNKKFNI